jgi:hypothetical protein
MSLHWMGACTCITRMDLLFPMHSKLLRAHLCDNIFRYAIAPSLPSCRNLTSHRATKLKRLRYENACAFLEFCRPLTTFTSPDITFVTVLHFEFLRFRVGYFDRLKIMNKLHFLIEDFFARIIATEEFRY